MILRPDCNPVAVRACAVLRRLGDKGPRRMLIGALFSGEYALESAALFNPSIVPHPDQEGLPAGALRIILSLRATGEGHISAIEFRSGILSAEGELSLDPATPFVSVPRVLPAQRPGCTSELRFSARLDLSERAIFPVAPEERSGIEDARFVRCADGLYCATYTAYDGRNIQPRLIETRDFQHFQMFTLGGDAIRDKGMALFPRQVGGRHVMLSRQDGENPGPQNRCGDFGRARDAPHHSGRGHRGYEQNSRRSAQARGAQGTE